MESAAAVLGVVSSSAQRFAACFISEFDGHLDDRDVSVPNYKIFRHYPGVGSFALGWVINTYMTGFLVAAPMWRGRCGALHLRFPTSAEGKLCNLWIIGVHGAHGDLLLESLADVRYLVGCRPLGAKVFLCGDWNVDLLPAHAADPWCHLPGRLNHHYERRMQLESLLDVLGVSTVIPELAASVPGGPFSAACAGAPITRIPWGLATNSEWPSLLDFGAAVHGLVKSSTLHWKGVHSDHAIVEYQLVPSAVIRRQKKTRWICEDEEGCMNWLVDKSEELASCSTASDCAKLFLECQEEYRCTKTCAQRRRDRVPLQARDLFKRAAEQSSEVSRLVMLKKARAIIIEHRRKADAACCRDRISKGGVFTKTKKLHRVESLVLSDGVASTCVDDWELPVRSFFVCQWGCNRLQDRLNIVEFCEAVEHHPPSFSYDELLQSAEQLGKRRRCDAYGVLVAILFAS